VEKWYQVAVLSVGGVLGVNARYWLGVAISRWSGAQFPWATFAINISGSFAIGFLSVLLARWVPHPLARLLVVVGFLGGYTTFSSFSFEALALWERGERGLSLAYMVGSVAAGFAAVILGTALGNELTVPSAERAAAEQIAAPEPDQTGGLIMIPAEAQLLSIHVGAGEQYGGKRLYEAIVEKARAMNLAGASVFPVEMSFGGHRQIHDVVSDYSFIELPVLIEIIDAPQRVRAFVSALGTMIAPAMVTIEAARVIRYSHTEAR
jgi:fluoride exporter